jgi:putative flippase GtrA
LGKFIVNAAWPVEGFLQDFQLQEMSPARERVNRLATNELARFLFFGAVNVVVTYVLYAAFLQIVSAAWAYTISYIVGVVLAYYLNSKYVFRCALSPLKALTFPLVYLVQYVIGLGIVHIWVNVLYLHPLIAPLLASLGTLPITFFMSRIILKEPAAE